MNWASQVPAEAICLIGCSLLQYLVRLHSCQYPSCALSTTSRPHCCFLGLRAVAALQTVCSQAVLERSTKDVSNLFFSIHDHCTHKVYFGLCNPLQQAYEEVSKYSMLKEADKVAEWLKTYVLSNAEVLRT